MIWLLLDLDFRSAIAMKVKFIFFDVLSNVLSKSNFFNGFQNITFFLLFLSSMTVNENIFDILFYWKEVIYVIMLRIL